MAFSSVAPMYLWLLVFLTLRTSLVLSRSVQRYSQSVHLRPDTKTIDEDSEKEPLGNKDPAVSPDSGGSSHMSRIRESVGIGNLTPEEDKTWINGVVLCLISSTLTSLGVVIQKYAHNQDKHIANTQEPAKSTIFYFRGWWMIGFSVWLVAQVINMCAMGLAPQTMLSCFGSWTIICNVLIAGVILGEQITTGECLGLLGLLMGMVFVIIGAPHSFVFSGDLNLLTSQFVSPTFIILTLAVAFAMIGLRSYLDRPQVSKFRIGIYWAICSAVLSGYSALLFKCCSLMILHVPNGVASPWLCAESYVIVACATAIGILEIHTLNLGLKTLQAVVLVPVYLSLGMVAQIMTNGVFFKEFSQFVSNVQIVLFVIGVVLSVVFVGSVFAIRASSDQSLFLDEDEVPVTPEVAKAEMIKRRACPEF